MQLNRVSTFALTAGLGAAVIGAFVFAAEPEKPQAQPPSSDNGKYFKADAVSTDGAVDTAGGHVNYTAIAGTIIVHAKGWDDVPRVRRQGRQGSAGRRGEEPLCRSVDVLCRLFQEGCGREGASDHLRVQRRTRLGDRVAAHGRIRTEARRDLRQRAHPGLALQRREQRLKPARRQRPRVHRRAGRGLQPHRGQGQGKGVLRRRRGRPRLRRLHQHIPVEICALEFAQIHLRRKLRHDARGGSVEPAGDELRHRPERRDHAVADPEFRHERRRTAGEPRRQPALSARTADLCGDGLVSQQAAGQEARRPAQVPGRGAALRDGRLRAGACRPGPR